MSSLGIEIGSMFFSGIYLKDGKCLAVDTADGKFLFGAYSRKKVDGKRYGSQLLASAFSGDPILTNMCLFHLVPKELLSEHIGSYSLVPLVVNEQNRYDYGVPTSTRKSTRAVDIISVFVRKITRLYETDGSVSSVTCSVPDAYFLQPYKTQLSVLEETLIKQGIPNLKLIGEKDAVMKYLERRNLISGKKVIIICCGEAFNSYSVVIPGKDVKMHPTPKKSGYSLAIALEDKVFSLMDLGCRNAYNGLSDKERNVFSNALFFSVRISLYKWLTTREAPNLEVVFFLNQEKHSVQISKDVANALSSEYAMNLASHAYEKVCMLCSTRSTPHFQDYEVYLCGDYSAVPQLKTEIAKKFGIEKESAVHVLDVSTFAEGALFSSPEIRPDNKRPPRSSYPQSTMMD